MFKARIIYFFVILLKMIFNSCSEAAAQDGDSLYRAKCAACHKVYPPQKYTYQKFETYVARYGKALSEEERQRLLGYLKENAKSEDAVK